MTEAEEAAAAARAAGFEDVRPEEASGDERGILLPAGEGWLLVSHPFDYGDTGVLRLRSVHASPWPEPLVHPLHLVAEVPGQPLLALTDPSAFAAFARWASTRVPPAVLATLLVQQQGPPGPTILVASGDELDAPLSAGQRARLGEVAPFRSHAQPDGGWEGRFASFTYLGDSADRLTVLVSDWDGRFGPADALWQREDRGRPHAVGG